MENYTSISYTTSKPKSKNKLKLFGAEIGFSQTQTPENEYIEDDGMSFNSSSTMSPSPPEKKKKKKYECKWCFKVLPNSQALGGHQNAHKKERLLKKIQLQASQAAGYGYYVDQTSQDYCYSNEQISFGSGGDDGYFCGSEVTFQEENHVHGFSLTHGDNMCSTSNYHHLDLQLGLRL